LAESPHRVDENDAITRLAIRLLIVIIEFRILKQFGATLTAALVNVELDGRLVPRKRLTKARTLESEHCNTLDLRQVRRVYLIEEVTVAATST